MTVLAAMAQMSNPATVKDCDLNHDLKTVLATDLLFVIFFVNICVIIETFKCAKCAIYNFKSTSTL